MYMLKEIPYSDINTICRICLIKSDDMRSVFSKLGRKELLEVNVECISDVLSKITTVSISESDGFPKLVCSNCLTLVLSAYKFKIQFDNSYNLLRHYLLKSAKEEQKQMFTNHIAAKNECDLSEYNVSSELSLPKSEQYRDSVETGTSTAEEQIAVSPKQVECNVKTVQKLGNRKQERGRGNGAGTSNKTSKTEEVVKTYPCPICTKEFPALELKQHAHTHQALKSYLKIPASKKVKPGIKFYYVRSNHPPVSIHNRKEKLHKCVSCDAELNAVEFRVHLDTHKDQKDFKCDQCERVFKKMNHLNTHRVKHLKEFPFKCQQCDKGFVIKTNYECHMLTHNADQELPYECTQCLRRFYNPEHLNRHMVLHTENVSYSEKYKVCKCYHCLKPFKDRDELKAHHCVPVEQTRKTQYPCKDCGKILRNAAALYNHTRNIHTLHGGKALCTVCGLHVANIYNHMMRHNGDKRHHCNVCGKRFVGKPQLRQHLLVHSGLKPFVCKICSKAFNNSYNMQVHERIHTGDKNHICYVCNKGFLEKSYLKKHMNVHTKC